MPRLTQFVIDLELALQLCEAARARASARAAQVSVAVVDAGGHLVAFQRMDGAEIAGPVLARDKDLTGMFAADGGRYVCFPGGLPLWSGDRVVAGVGVSGGSADDDADAAQAAAGVWALAEEAGRV
jgi:uncharacterized protein GlcG (DUF336 family)